MDGVSRGNTREKRTVDSSSHEDRRMYCVCNGRRDGERGIAKNIKKYMTGGSGLHRRRFFQVSEGVRVLEELGQGATDIVTKALDSTRLNAGNIIQGRMVYITIGNIGKVHAGQATKGSVGTVICFPRHDTRLELID